MCITANASSDDKCTAHLAGFLRLVTLFERSPTNWVKNRVIAACLVRVSLVQLRVALRRGLDYLGVDLRRDGCQVSAR